MSPGFKRTRTRKGLPEAGAGRRGEVDDGGVAVPDPTLPEPLLEATLGLALWDEVGTDVTSTGMQKQNEGTLYSNPRSS